MTAQGATTSADGSLWFSGPAPGVRPSATGELTADVAVIGAGITGMTTALLLARAGLRVAVCEAGVVASGVSGHSTAKVTALQATVYSTIRARHGRESARAYAAGSLAAVETVAALASGIDCALERRPAFTFAMARSEASAVEAEAAAEAGAGEGHRRCGRALPRARRRPTGRPDRVPSRALPERPGHRCGGRGSTRVRGHPGPARRGRRPYRAHGVRASDGETGRGGHALPDVGPWWLVRPAHAHPLLLHRRAAGWSAAPRPVDQRRTRPGRCLRTATC